MGTEVGEEQGGGEGVEGKRFRQLEDIREKKKSVSNKVSAGE